MLRASKGLLSLILISALFLGACGGQEEVTLPQGEGEAGQVLGKKASGKTKNPKLKTYVFKGQVLALAQDTSELQVEITGGNKLAYPYVQKIINFKVDRAQLSIDDTNRDGFGDLKDLEPQDQVSLLVKVSSLNPEVAVPVKSLSRVTTF